MPAAHPLSVDVANERVAGRLPGLLGVEFREVEEGRAAARLEIRPHHLAPNGFLHAASVIALADTACGFGAMRALPPGGSGFTTVELKANFLGTSREGAIACEARLVHGGRATQVWDATVVDERSGKTLALFRCTQLVLYAE
jgi:uncharacterized protein (TIGR00369 family)